MDTFLFQKINSLVGAYSFLDKIVWFLAEPLAYILVGLGLLALFWPQVLGLKKSLPVVWALAAALFARLLVKNLIVFFYNRPRPFDVLEVNQLATQESFASFPSGHAIFFFTLATVLILYNRKLGALLFAGATLIGISRVFAGLHWPSDVIFGASLGMLIGVLTFILAERTAPRVKNQSRLSESLKSTSL
ncbi:MAG: bacitracin transporter permease BcrC [Parcubacteria group bacterium Gr01-1014_107]|nr:MAG: bacitracin transporter permease BcrC [Parcubacteria group bacterium Gr01-1014_107]